MKSLKNNAEKTFMVKVREASFKDYEFIMHLLKRHGFHVKSYIEWQHLWKNNPVLKDFKGSWPIGWILEDESKKRIVGYIGNIPIGYEIQGVKMIAAVSSSWIVDKPYRNYSLMLLHKYYTQNTTDLYFTTSANETGEALYIYKARKLPVQTYNISLFWITNYAGFVCSVLSKYKIPLSNIFSYPLSFFLWAYDKLRGGNRYNREIKKGILYFNGFNEDFDIFWEKLKGHSDTIMSIRNSETLNWHFKYAIKKGNIWIYAVKDNSEITAYAIFLKEDNPEYNLKRYRLVDMQTTKDAECLMDLISVAIKRCKEEGVHMLEVLGFNNEKRNIMEKCYPHMRSLSYYPFFYKIKNRSMLNLLENPQSWDPCLFDGDSSL